MEPGSLPRRLSWAWDKDRSFGSGVGASALGTNVPVCMQSLPGVLDLWYLLATCKFKLQ